MGGGSADGTFRKEKEKKLDAGTEEILTSMQGQKEKEKKGGG